jgi:hypothetical protein
MTTELTVLVSAVIQAAIAYEEAWSGPPDGSSIAFRWERVGTARSALLEAVRALKEET